MSFALLLAALAASATLQSQQLSEADCGYVETSRGPGAPFVGMSNLHVLAQTAMPGAFSADIPAGASIVCQRSSIVPAENDWKVPAAGYSLYLANGDGPDERIGVLELASGSYRYRLIRGTWTVDEQNGTEARVQTFLGHARRDEKGSGARLPG
jgi:hypothetical protein